MVADPPGAGKRQSWRRPGGRSAPASGRASTPGQSSWTQKKDRQYDRARRRHLLKIAAGGLLLIGLIVGFVIYVIHRPMRTPLVAVAVTDYVYPVPPNAFAREDLDQLRTLDDREIVSFAEVPWETNEQGMRGLCQEVDAVRPGGPGKNVVIVYLSMHGAVNGADEPCLLPPAPYLSDSGRWLRVRDLLEELFVKDRPGRLPDKVQKLLILDCSRMDSNWNLGLLYNAFPERLKIVLEELKVPNLSVLSSSSPGQRSWASPELGGSVFGYFVWQGLMGAADAEQFGNQDKVVSLEELHRYLSAHVAQWVTENRADVQQPMLLSPDPGVELVYARAATGTTIPEPSSQVDPRWKTVADLWQKHRRLLAGAPYVTRPLAWESFQHKLLRLEQLLLAGSAYRDEFRQTSAELETLSDALAEDPVRSGLAAYSLPLAGQLRHWRPDAAAPAWFKQGLAAAPESAPAGTSPADSSPAKSAPQAATQKDKVGPGAKLQAKPGAPPAAKPPPQPGSQPPAADPAVPSKPVAAPARPASGPQPVPSYFDVAQLAWSWSLEHADRKTLSGVLKLVGRSQRALASDVIEAHFLRMLREHLDWESASGGVRQALLARDLAERAAAPADVRAQYWAWPLVDPAEVRRRLAEDKLFVGDAKALDEAGRVWEELCGQPGAGGTYREAIQRADQVSNAYRLRDRAWAETPYLAQWLLARLHQASPEDLGKLRNLIRATRTLASELDRASVAGLWSDELQKSARDVQDNLEQLDKTLADASHRLAVSAAGDKQTLRDIGLVLSVPLVTGAQRNRLREKYLQIAVDRAGADYLATAPDGAPGAAGAEAGRAEERPAASPFLQRLERLGTHPALTILEGTPTGQAEAGSAPRAALPEQGEHVRRRLAGLAAAAAKSMAETTRVLQAKGAVALAAAARAGYGKADCLVRASAALAAEPPWTQWRETPTGRLRQLDLHYLMLWQCRRALDDFWGPAPGRQNPYFQEVAGDYLASARELCKDDARLEHGGVVLPGLLETRRRAAEQGVRLEQPKDIIVDEEEAATPHGLTVDVPGNLPGGEAAVYLQDRSGRTLPLESRPDQTPPELRRMSAPAGAAGQTALAYLVPNTERLRDESVLEATALYRGHVRSRDVYVQPAHGLSIPYQRVAYRQPTVAVYGTARQRSSIVFILDYSGSMDKTLVREGKPIKKHAVAREALLSILRRLVDPDKPYRVGVLLYGHRVGWNPKDQSQIIMWDPENPERVIPEPPDVKLHPADDVQTILPLGRFTEKDLAVVREKLKPLKPLGETPLYLSILEAIKELGKEASSGRRRIVAVTDGVNWQSDGGQLGLKLKKDVDDALRSSGNRDIRLDVVGFELTEKDLQSDVSGIQDPSAREEFLQELLGRFRDLKSLAGAFYPANDPSSLLAALERSLELRQYVVLPARGQPAAAPRPAELGTTWQIEQSPDRKVAYVAKVLDPERPVEAAFDLEGGEALELEFRDNPRRLAFRHYDKDLRDYRSEVPDPLDPRRRLFLGAHLPEWHGGTVEFRVSVQSVDTEAFSPRPAEAWVEIRQRFPGTARAVPVYVFYDPSYQPACTAPVLSCLALSWPPEAKEAEIQIWCKISITPPDKVVTVSELKGQTLRVEGLPEVNFTLETKRGEKPEDPYRLTVVERHAPGTDLYTAKVEMNPSPAKITRRYIPETGTVRHTFFYPDSAAPEIGTYRVSFTSRRRLVQEAVHPDSPLVVTVPRNTIPAGPQR